MKVNELQELLAHMDPEAELYVYDGFCGVYQKLIGVENGGDNTVDLETAERS